MTTLTRLHAKDPRDLLAGRGGQFPYALLDGVMQTRSLVQRGAGAGPSYVNDRRSHQSHGSRVVRTCARTRDFRNPHLVALPAVLDLEASPSDPWFVIGTGEGGGSDRANNGVRTRWCLSGNPNLNPTRIAGRAAPSLTNRPFGLWAFVPGSPRNETRAGRFCSDVLLTEPSDFR